MRQVAIGEGDAVASTPGHVLHYRSVGFEAVCECERWSWRPPAPVALPDAGGLMTAMAATDAEIRRRHAEHVREMTGCGPAASRIDDA